MRAADAAAIVEASKDLTSWALFENQTCAMIHTNHADVLPPAAEDEPISNNKVPTSSEPTSSESSSSESDEDYEEDDQKNPAKTTDEPDDSDDSDDEDDDDDDAEYDGDNNEIEIDDRTKGKRKDGLYAEEIDVIKDRINKRECSTQ